MKKQLLYLSLACFSIFTGIYRLQSQVLFLEDFDHEGGPTAGGAGTYIFTNGSPAPFLLRNVDNGTPAGTVAYVNEAWERREDFSFNVIDSCAFSTSWYTPVVTANDWMWTPLIGPLPGNSLLSWNAVTYDVSYRDGYEVRIMTQSSTPGGPTGSTGVIGNQITNSTVLFSTGAENTTWTARNVNLNTYAGESVWIGFRNNSNDKFLLLIDDIKVEVILNYDGETVLLDTLSEYTIIPKSQVSPLPLEATIRNNGALSVTNATLNVKVFDGSMNQVFSSSSTPMTLTAGQTANVTAGTWTPPAIADDYTVQYYTTITETDGQPGNDTLYSYISVDDSTYARDNGNVTGSLGIGAGEVGYIGQEFMINANSRLKSVGVYITIGHTGRKLGLAVWNMNSGIPSSIVAVTDTIIYPDDSARYYVIPMHGGDFNITPGSYVVTAIEFDSTLAVAQTNQLFTNGRTWVNWPSSPFAGWANNEDFGTGFAKSYIIRPYLFPMCSSSIIQSTGLNNATCGNNDGDAVVHASGTGPFTYSWSNGSTDSTATGLAAGTYTVTVTDQSTLCSETATVDIINIDGPAASITASTDETCTGCADGTATVTPAGGTPPYTYSWSPSGGTNATASGLTGGTYTVTVTDNNGCTSTTTVTINTASNSGIQNQVTADEISIYPNPSNGTFTLNVSIPYTGNARIEIIDIQGKTIHTQNVNITGSLNGNKITVTGIAKGTYALRFTAGQHRYMRKLVVE